MQIGSRAENRIRFNRVRVGGFGVSCVDRAEEGTFPNPVVLHGEKAGIGGIWHWVRPNTDPEGDHIHGRTDRHDRPTHFPANA